MTENIIDGRHIEILPSGFAVIRGDCGAGSWVYQLGRLDYDRGMLDRIVPLLHKDMAVLDIGAFIGSHSFEYLKHTSCVISFEPNPSAFACLSHNCPNAVKINTAIGDKTTNRYWTRIIPNYGASYLADTPSPDCLTVPVRTLDSYDLDNIGFIKVDAEGEEVNVLRGAEKTIKYNHPHMCLEVNDAALKRTGTDRNELMRTLYDYGYAVEPVVPGGDHQNQFDVIATPR